jgi:GntR family transcriptional regulator
MQTRKVAEQIEQGPVPLYLQLERILREQIDKGDLKPGSALPTEQELMSIYNLSRTTVRRALSQLARDKVVVKIQGKGTYVSQPEVKQELASLRTLSEVLTDVGLVPKVRVLGVDVNPEVPSRVRQQLQLGPKETILCVKRQHLVQGNPIALATIYLSGKFQWRFSIEELACQSIYDWLEEQEHILVDSGVQVITAMPADEEIAVGLGLQPGDPVLHVENTSASETGVPIDYTDFYFPPNRYALTITLQRTRAGVSLEDVKAGLPEHLGRLDGTDQR